MKFPKPWFRKGRGWFVTLDGQQIKLGKKKAESLKPYQQLMAQPKQQAVIATILCWRSSMRFLTGVKNTEWWTRTNGSVRAWNASPRSIRTSASPNCVHSTSSNGSTKMTLSSGSKTQLLSIDQTLRAVGEETRLCRNQCHRRSGATQRWETGKSRVA